MNSKISQILKEIENKKNELIAEYSKIKSKYGFSFKQWKITFSDKAREYNKKFKKWFFKYIFSIKARHLVSVPFIWMMIIPVFILDVFLFIYQQICFRLYGIPFVKRIDYIVYDRRHLDYLNFVEKMWCLYCSYVNWFLAYATEIAWRTEKYWCPIKHARKSEWIHKRQKEFADYWDPEGFRECYTSNEVFYKK